MQISTQCASSTAAAIASNVEPDIISVSIHTLNPLSRILLAMRSTVTCTSHWYLRQRVSGAGVCAASHHVLATYHP